MIDKYDFGGYVTRNDVECADGRIIRSNAFEKDDGKTVPLVWMHRHNEIDNVLGHAVLENRSDGVYGYCFLNDSTQGESARVRIKNGDLTGLSIYANQLKSKGPEVVHGVIREVSLVIAGANPEAYINDLQFAHSDGSVYDSDEEADIYMNDKIEFPNQEISHSDEDANSKDKTENEDKTIEDVINSMTEEQRNVLYYLVGEAENNSSDENDNNKDDEEIVKQSDDKGEDFMSHNIFDAAEDNKDQELIHSAISEAFADAPRYGSLKKSLEIHMGEIQHSITDIDTLFPDANTITNVPELYKRTPDGWVFDVWNATKKTPFSRVKTVVANVTADEARAKGYTKGNKKIEEVFNLLKRVTTPQTVYKLQKIDRDDVIDITDLDVVAFMKEEMRVMLNEELSRAILVGDGRSSSAEDKIKEDNIRPVYTDDELYTIHYNVNIASNATTNEKSDALVEAAIRARKEYRGSGNPVFYASTDVINDMLLATDDNRRRLYASTNELAAALRVSRIVEVPIMEGITRTDSESKSHELLGLIVNLNDYVVGADKGGAVTMFDDFDIDYNKYSYLLETRCSGALVKPKAAIALEKSTTVVSG